MGSGVREGGSNRVWEEGKCELPSYSILYLFTPELIVGEKEESQLYGGGMCVCSFFYAISLIHGLETFKYLTYVMGIKVRPAFLVCSGSSAFVSFLITKLRTHLWYKSQRISLYPSSWSCDRIPPRSEIYRHSDLSTLSSFFIWKDFTLHADILKCPK